MSPRASAHDAVVVGGGPAGSAAARLLALWGREVLLLAGADRRSSGLGESLPPSAGKLFDVLEITDAIEDAGFLASRGNTVWWGEEEARTVDFPDGSGWQVERRRFDALLLSLAEDAGAEVRRGATVESVDLETGEPEVRFRLRGGGSSPARDRPARAPWILDCSGRAGVLASRGLRTRQGAAPTNALIGAWRRAGGWGLPTESHTLVEGYRDGWAWSIPVDPEVRYFTTMVDPEVTDLSRGTDLESMYRGELEKTTHIAPLLSGAVPVSDPWGCGAGAYSASRFAGPGFLLVGDAASFIDPLSSYGVKKALASAWLAAVVVNTLLEKPELTGEALAFYEAREREAYWHHAAQAASFYAEGEAFYGHAFWSRRCRDHASREGADQASGEGRGLASPRGTASPTDAAAAAEPAGAGAPSPDIEAVRNDPRVLAAFEDLRQAPEVRLRLARPMELVRAPAVRGRTLALEDRLVTAAFPAGIRFLRDVDLVRLTSLAATLDSTRADVPGLFEQYRNVAGPVALPDFLGGLSVLLAEGVLENAAAESPSTTGVAPLS